MTNIKKISSFIAIVFLFTILSVPAFVYTAPSPATSSTGSEGTGITYECGEGLTAGECTFDDLIKAVKRVVDFMVVITLSLSVVVIAYAGFRYMMYSDNAGKRAETTKMFYSVAKGIVVILAAWLIVTLITNTLLTEEVKNVVPLQ
jgi:preprotein translocase subunit YajC